MLIYDLGRMAKRLLIFYMVVIVFQIILGRVAPLSVGLLSVSALVTFLVNLRLFYKDYIGKDAVVINMLPVRPTVKILSKLITGYVFLMLSSSLLIFIAFYGSVVYIMPYVLSYAAVFFLAGYVGASIFKYVGKWYHVAVSIIAINTICLLISMGVYYIVGYVYLPLIHLVMCLILFIVCRYNIEK